MGERMAVVVNPASANGTTAGVWPQLATGLREAGFEFQAYLTSGPGDATALCRRALENGATTIVSVGGDGTINEVVNGFFLEDRALNPEARLGVISRGTGCDFIRTMGIPKPGDEAIRRLAQGRTRVLDVGRARHIDNAGNPAVRYFLNIAELGMGAETVRRVNNTSKAMGGFLSFLYGVLVTIATYRNRPVTISVDGGPSEEHTINDIVIANGRFFGGGMEIAPQALPDDGLFDVVILGDLARLELFLNLPRVYRGTHLSHPKISFRRARTVTVRSLEPVLLEVDGEQPGRAEAEITVLPGAIRVIS